MNGSVPIEKVIGGFFNVTLKTTAFFSDGVTDRVTVKVTDRVTEKGD